MITGGIHSNLKDVSKKCFILDMSQEAEERVCVISDLLEARYQHSIAYGRGKVYAIGG